MQKSPLSGFAFLGGICVGFFGVLANAAAEEAKPEAAAKSALIVHGWGVLWVGSTGGKTLIGARNRSVDALPEFVLRNEEVSPSAFQVQPELHIIDKPVIHIYGPEGLPVEVTVRVPKGTPLAYYPRPQLEKKTGIAVDLEGKSGTLTQTESMTWKFALTKTAPEKMPTPSPGHWWNAAREIPGDYIVMNEEDAGNERFLFYEGTTFQDPTITAHVFEKSIILKNAHSTPSEPVILIINDNGSRRGVYVDSVAAHTQFQVLPDKLESWDEETLLAKCRKQWEACGMTPEEARGIVNVWRPELLETPGFLLISALPDAIYESIFRLVVKPKPSELERACLVFDTLAGQDERKHWTPSLGRRCQALIDQLSAESFAERMEAQSKLIEIGESLSPFVKEIIYRPTADAQSKMAATILAKILANSPVRAGY